MNFLNLVFIFLLIQSTLLFPHDPDKAYFEFHQEGDKLIVKAEFPWTLRLALLNKYPELEKSSEQKDFDEALFNYLKNNIVIKEEDKTLKLKEVRQLETNQSHSVIYNLIFKKLNDLQKVNINNICMFELYNKQKNYNTVFLPGNKEFTFVSEENNPTFTITNEEDKSNVGWVIFLAIVFGGLVVYYFRKSGRMKRYTS